MVALNSDYPVNTKHLYNICTTYNVGKCWSSTRVCFRTLALFNIYKWYQLRFRHSNLYVCRWYHFNMPIKNLQDLEQIPKRNLKNLRKLSKIWRVDFSTAKTKCIMFSNIKIIEMPTIKLVDEILEFVENHKLLGIILNKKMSWDNHMYWLYLQLRKQMCWYFT